MRKEITFFLVWKLLEFPDKTMITQATLSTAIAKKKKKKKIDNLSQIARIVIDFTEIKYYLNRKKILSRDTI